LQEADLLSAPAFFSVNCQQIDRYFYCTDYRHIVKQNVGKLNTFFGGFLSDFALRIAEFKTVLGIDNQSAFAKDLGISRTTLIGYEDGSVAPSANFLAKICQIYNVNINWFLTGKGEMFLLNTGKETSNPPQLPKLKAKVDQRLEEIETQISEIRNCFKEINS